MKVLHFADAHINSASYGRYDLDTGLPIRVMDFLKSLDIIVDTAINEKVDLVIFAGDAYKDRNPAPTYQREWGKRMMRLSCAGIQTILLVGNHDNSPSQGRANALEEYATLEVPFIKVINKPCMLTPKELGGLQVEILAIPWISQAEFMASFEITDFKNGRNLLEEKITAQIQTWLENRNTDIPTILTAHASVQGAIYGGERAVMLGKELVFPASLVSDSRLDYVALGHIHKNQNLNPDSHPPVIYPGSIERVDFGEADDDKFFVIANVEKGATTIDWRKFENTRPFIDCSISLDSQDGVTEKLIGALPEKSELTDAVVRLTIDYPRDYESLIDEPALYDYATEAFQFRLVKRPRQKSSMRILENQNISSLSTIELLEKYWEHANIENDDIPDLKNLAEEILQG